MAIWPDTNRDEVRARLAHLWQRRGETRTSWPLEEQNIVAQMEAHQELHALWERLGHFGSREIVVGDMNPLVHVILHAVVENQLALGDPPEARNTLDALMRRGFSHQRAVHVIGSALSREIFSAMRSDAHNPARYRGRLRLIAQGAENPPALHQLVARTGRNDLCPCGSGDKFKRCCIDFLPVDMEPSDWTTVLEGGTPFCSWEYAAEAPEGDTSLILQNASAVAIALEEQLADTEGADLGYRMMADLARKEGSEGHLANVLQDWVDFALRNPDFAEHGIAAAEELLRARPDWDEDTRLTLELDRADLLAACGRVAEGDEIYRRALAQVSDAGDSSLREIVDPRWDDWQAEHGAP